MAQQHPSDNPSLPATSNKPVSKDTRYSVSRMNALRHGILSKYVVLRWEDQSEYDELLSSFVAEHQPKGPTEFHQVEELAGVVWRKRRIRLAEASSWEESAEQGMNHIMGGLNVNYFLREEQTPDYSLLVGQKGIGKAILPQIKKLSATYDLGDEALVSDAHSRLLKTIAWLENNDGGSYEEFKNLLHPHTEEVIELVVKTLGVTEPEPDYLVNVLKNCMLGVYQAILNNIHNLKYANLALITSKVDHASLEKLSRYETTLDRKFERTLTVLLKLQQLRLQREAIEV